MKILYLNPDPGIPVLGDKGASVHVREFVTAVAQAGHDPVVVCASLGEGNAPPPAKLIELRAEAGDEALQLECALQGLPQTALEDRMLRRELRWLEHDRQWARRTRDAFDIIGFRPDVLYERHALFHSSGADLARSLGVPRLLEVNAPLVQEQERFRGLVLKSRATEIERASYASADRIIAVSEEVASHVRSTGVPPARVLTVPNGVDVSRFHPAALAGDVRDTFGEGPVIGFIGSFKAWHGTDFLIRAFADLADRHAGVRLACVGEGPRLESLRAEVVARGLQQRVITTGRVPHDSVPAHLAAMDVTVAPYTPEEDFYFSPLKVVESLAAGVPVVAARIGQLEKLIDDGKTGLLFTPGDERDFVDKTLWLLRNPAARLEMGAAARARAVADFSWNHAVQRILAETASLIQTRAAA